MSAIGWAQWRNSVAPAATLRHVRFASNTRRCTGAGDGSPAGASGVGGGRYDPYSVLTTEKIGGVERVCREVRDEPYDDEKDHIRCIDCKGSGYYVGFTERRLCPTCDGSGFV